MIVAKSGGEYRIIDRAFPIQRVKLFYLLAGLLTRMKGSVPSGYGSQDRVKLPGLMGSMFFDPREKFRFLDQVVPLMGVVRVIVKLFRTVVVMDVAVAFGTDAVVSRTETGACHIGPLRPSSFASVEQQSIATVIIPRPRCVRVCHSPKARLVLVILS